MSSHGTAAQFANLRAREKNRNEARAAKKWDIINGAPVAARPGAVWAVLYRLTAFNQACVSTIVL